MSKDIGYRFYDYDSKKMIYLGDNSTRDNGYMECFIEIDMIGMDVYATVYGNDIPKVLRSYETMEYVCKDKTGRDVYECDLYEDEEHQLFEVKFNDDDLCYELMNVFIPGSTSLKYINDKESSFRYVGNKYENKELLEI